MLFLASEDLSYIIGQDIAIDGGILPLWQILQGDCFEILANKVPFDLLFMLEQEI